MRKNPTSLRLSDDAIDLVALLARRMGVSKSAVIELAIRRLAKDEQGEEPPMQPMHLYEVGKPYSATRSTWPEGCEFLFDQAGCTLRLFFANPTPQEVRDVRRGTAEFALAPIENTLYLLFRFGTSVTWSEASYTYQRMPADQRPALDTPIGPETRQVLTIFLVNAFDGILIAMRQVTFSPEATQLLHTTVAAQAAQPYDTGQYDALIDRIMQQYTSDQLLQFAKARWFGGQ